MARGRTTQATSESENTTVSQDEINPDATAETAGTEAEAGTAEGGHTFNVGDEASVIRGKLRGRKGSILKYNATDKTYAVELEDGTLAVLNAGNLKAPVDSTVSVRALVSTLAGFGQEAGTADRDAVVRIAAMLDSVAPGTSVKLAEAFSA
jgi:hypothetical protein